MIAHGYGRYSSMKVDILNGKTPACPLKEQRHEAETRRLSDSSPDRPRDWYFFKPEF